MRSTIDALASLVDKSLLRRHGERLGMLQTIRAFAVEKLAASVFADDIGDRHAAHFAQLVANACEERAMTEKDAMATQRDEARARALSPNSIGSASTLSGIKFWGALLDRYLSIARAEGGPVAAETAWQAGRQLDFESAVSEALAEPANATRLASR